MTDPYPNLLGRKGGRGLRPWLLIPKVLAVAGLFGGTLAVAVLLTTGTGKDPAAVRATLEHVREVYRWLLLPSATLAVLTGIGLTLQHPGPLLRQRWLQVKLLLVLVALPTLHLLCRHLYSRAVQSLGSTSDSSPNQPPALTLAALAVVILLALVIFLGRHKPRLGR